MKAEILLATSNFVCPGPTTMEGVRVSVLNTGWVTTDRKKIIQGAHSKEMELPLLVGHIQHPDGDVYVDAGLGQTSRSNTYPRFPLSTQNIHIPPGWALAEQTTEPPKTVLMTHLHYDHIGGLLDLSPHTEVWTTEEEWRTARTSNLFFPDKRMSAAVSWRPVVLEAGRSDERLGVPAMDVKGDGTIWYLSTPGHTPGSASVLVHAEDGAWLFIGDTAWVNEHIAGASRPGWVSLLVDGRPSDHKRALQWVRTLHHLCPSLNIVAGHEASWTKP